MKNKIIKIILIISVLALVFIFDSFQKKSETENIVAIVQFKESNKKDTYIKRTDLKVVKLSKENFQPIMMLETSFKPGFLKQEVYKNTFVYKELLADEPSFKLEENQRLITLKCSTLESNGWTSEAHDFVDILMIGEAQKHLIENAKVLKRFDQNLSSEGVPEYYTFIVTVAEAMMYYENLKISDVYIVVK